MKAYVIVTILSLASISSVASTTCLKKFIPSQGLAPDSKTNFYYHQVRNEQSVDAGAAQVGKQR